jgi:hypothetical protein
MINFRVYDGEDAAVTANGCRQVDVYAERWVRRENYPVNQGLGGEAVRVKP